jgi:O-antigen/teichoic acid export membrane protein
MQLGRNLLAGLAGSAWVAVVGLAATPFYLDLLGLEAYGMIGFFLTLQALISLLDVGLSPTMNREVARGLVEGSLPSTRSLLRSLSALYWLSAVAIGVAVLAGSSWLAGHWLRSKSIPHHELENAVMLMGLAIAARWPAGLYFAAANGAQRIVSTSGLTAAHATLSALGAILLMELYSATLQVFFAWQIVVALAYTLSLRQVAWSSLHGRQGAGVDMSQLLRVWRFSVGMGLIAVSSVVFTQLDKALLSRMLDLAGFGRYILASMVSGSIYLLAVPVFNAMYPRFSALVAAGNEERLGELYRLGTRFLAVVVFPFALVLAVFPDRLVALWTGNAALAVAVSPVVSLLVAGSALHAMMYFPYALQLASGLPRLSLQINLILIALMVPLTIVLTLLYAEIGAARAWLLLHVFYLLFGTWMTHRRLLRGLASRWLLVDIGLPLMLTAATACAGVAAGVRDSETWAAWAVVMWGAAAAFCLAVSPALLGSARRLARQAVGNRSSQ